MTKRDLQLKQRFRQYSPDVLCLQEGAIRHQRAVEWTSQRGYQITMPMADITGPGPTESIAGCAVLSRWPADK
eukprot:8560364-Pyramimonas_sp.AAC.1